MIDSPDYEPHRVPYATDGDLEAWQRYDAEVDPVATSLMVRHIVSIPGFDVMCEIIDVRYGGVMTVSPVDWDYKVSYGVTSGPRRMYLVSTRELLFDVQRNWEDNWRCHRCGSPTCRAREGVACEQLDVVVINVQNEFVPDSASNVASSTMPIEPMNRCVVCDHPLETWYSHCANCFVGQSK